MYLARLESEELSTKTYINHMRSPHWFTRSVPHWHEDENDAHNLMIIAWPRVLTKLIPYKDQSKISAMQQRKTCCKYLQVCRDNCTASWNLELKNTASFIGVAGVQV